MILSFSSSNGGAGSSTILALIAKSLTSMDKSVAVVDFAESKFQDIYLGLDLEINPEFEEIQENDLMDLDTDIHPVLYNANSKNSAEFINEKLQLLKNKYDFMLLDFSSINSENLEDIMTDSDILVITQDNGSIRAGDKVLNSLSTEKASKTKFIINKFLDADIESLASIDAIFNIIEIDYLGQLSYIPDLRLIMNKGKPTDAPALIKEEISSILNAIMNTEPSSDSDSELDMDTDLNSEIENDSETNNDSADLYFADIDGETKADIEISESVVQDALVALDENEEVQISTVKSVGILERLKNFFKK